MYSTDAGGKLERAWSWPYEQVSKILSPGGDTTFKFSDDGVAEIVVDSGLAEYRYLLQHKVSKWLTFQDPKTIHNG